MYFDSFFVLWMLYCFFKFVEFVLLICFLYWNDLVEVRGKLKCLIVVKGNILI